MCIVPYGVQSGRRIVLNVGGSLDVLWLRWEWYAARYASVAGTDRADRLTAVDDRLDAEAEPRELQNRELHAPVIGRAAAGAQDACTAPDECAAGVTALTRAAPASAGRVGATRP